MERDYSFLDKLDRGMYFAKKEYTDTPLPSYEEVKEKLPAPVIEGEEAFTACYDYVLKILFRNMHKPTKESGFVSNFVDAAFNEDVFLWDTVFMTLFCNMLHPYVPGICSLDNFYCKQFDDGEIPREMVRDTGKDMLLWVNAFDKPLYSYFHNHYGFRRLKQLTNLPYEEMYKPELGRMPEKNPYLTLDNLNHPLLALGEWESYQQTGDIKRLQLVLEPLYQYYEALKYHLRHANGLYVTDWASMDNSPRNKYLGLAVDTSSEMALFAKNLLDMMEVLKAAGYELKDEEERKKELLADRADVKAAINQYLWNEEDGFYYDMTFEGKQTGIKTVAGFFPLLAEITDEKQTERLLYWLNDTETFNRPHRVPTVAANEPEYEKEGGYWRGSVWAPTNALVILALEKNGHHELAREIAVNHVNAITKVFQDTGTIWENYPPEYITSGNSDNPDFVGWSGLGPIRYLIEYKIGIYYRGEKLHWDLDSIRENKRLGCKRYWFAGKTADLLAETDGSVLKLQVETDATFPLVIHLGGKTLEFQIAGSRELTISLT